MAAKITTPHSLARQTGDFCFRHCSEFLTGNFSHAGLFLKEKIKFYSEPNYAYNNQFKFILDTTDIYHVLKKKYNRIICIKLNLMDLLNLIV